MQKSHELAHLFNPVNAHDCHPDPLFYDCVCPTYFHVGLHQHIFMLDLSLLLHVNVIKIQILVGTVVKVQLSFWNFYCYNVCQIKEGILVWFKLHQHRFNVVTLDENWFDVITKVKHSLEFCEVCSWFRTIQVLFEEELKNYSDCDYCEHGICYLD